ncbi:hypothetical protein Emag_000606 [Eimeria magna]
MRGPLCGGGPLGGSLGRCLPRLSRDIHTQPSAATAAASAARSRAAAAAAVVAPAAGSVPSGALGPHEWEGQTLKGRGPYRGPLFRAPLPFCWGRSRQVANFADAAAAAEADAPKDKRGDGWGASGKILTFSEMLEGEDSLSGLSDVYNNQVYASAAIAALLTNTPALYVDSNTFCDCLETLVFSQGPPEGPLNPRDRSRIRGLLEETFAEMQTSGNDMADAFDLILGLCHFCRSDDEERIKVLLTPYVAGMFRRARVTFSSVDDLAVASAIEIFKAKYPFLSSCERQEKGSVSPTAATATRAATPAAAASAAAACAQNKLFIDLTEEPWKSVACHAGLELTYEDFARVCQDIPKVASMTQTCLLRLPLIVTLRDLIDVEPAS